MKHFTIAELTDSTTARQNGIDNTPPESAVKALQALVERVLDPLREAWGKPITVNSGYRCAELNRKVGGAEQSQHLRGEAADITAGSRADNRKLYELLRRLSLPLDQAINERGYKWIHVSYTTRRHNRRQYLSIN
ncbi:MAG: D-Ala-D-Ala carboxypeptidase family metallohydrolase [Muribaculaceae bacterium]